MPSTEFRPDWFSKPGDTITALMARHALDAAELAQRIGKKDSVVHGLLAGTVAIDDEIATLLAARLGGSPNFWRARQQQFDEALHHVAEALPAEQSKSWLRMLPLKEMTDAGWISHAKGSSAVRAALAYFDVTGPEEWHQRYTSFANAFSFRTSPTYASKLGALAAWLRQGEIQAECLQCAPWQAKRLRANIDLMRRLTKLKNPASFIPRLRAYCADAGVAVVFVRAPAGCRASGATRFLSHEKAMIILSFRHLSDDHFWFTFFHEVAHLLLHDQDATFIDGGAADQTDEEMEANALSAGVLIPRDQLDALYGVRPKMKDIVRFAVSISIAPGIVVGQMQHHGLLGPAQLNTLKRRYTWEEVQAALS
jgi:plasmid maintenance system antidote protein VapI